MRLWNPFRRKREPGALSEEENPFSEENLAKVRRRHGLESRRARRSYEMAEDDRLASAWNTSTVSPDGTVRFALAKLRARARDLAENDAYITKFFQMTDDNVVGEAGIVPIPEPKSKRSAKQLDRRAAERISKAWKRFSKRGVITVCGKFSASALQKRQIRSTATDGEIFLIEVYGEAAGNEFGYALEVVEADLLDETYSDTLPNGNVVRMGIEVDRLRRPVAYHFLTQPPGDFMYAHRMTRSVERRRIEADRVIHCADFKAMRPGQTRAVTWFAPVGPALYQLHGYRKAEAVAARHGAEKMGFFKSVGEGDYEGEVADERNFVEYSEAGTFGVLPEGYDLATWDPDHPSTAFESFNKAMTRTAASGLRVNYNPLASDAEGTSYGTLRQFSLDDRSFYRSLQTWLIEECGWRDRIFANWLRSALLNDAIREMPGDEHGAVREFAEVEPEDREDALLLDDHIRRNRQESPLEYERLAEHRWQARGWQWIDPQKESQGNDLALRNTSRLMEDVIAETSGRTVDEHLDKLEVEREKFHERGFKHPSEMPAPEAKAADKPEDEDE